ncbi:MAG: DUF4124 domain-containing protein [Burkholderiales bacterium]|nr:DUF4124 domain-containing protein [Burkholderiales bacterium]
MLAPALTHAEIYKWTDANGQTHYSSNKADAGKGATTSIKVDPTPPPPPLNSPTSQAAQDHDKRFKQISEKPVVPPTYGAPNPPMPRSRSGGREDGSDASRCALAQDVLDGKLRYRGGKAIDQYGRETAQNDIRMFCH